MKVDKVLSKWEGNMGFSVNSVCARNSPSTKSFRRKKKE